MNPALGTLGSLDPLRFSRQHTYSVASLAVTDMAASAGNAGTDPSTAAASCVHLLTTAGCPAGA